MGERGDTTASGLEIAVVGMSGRFPGASSIEQYWENIRDGRESVKFFGREELLASGVDPQAVDDQDYVPAQAVLDDVEHFDAAFFGIAARDATLLDPQQRLLLECSWEALEDAGHIADGRSVAIGVFTSVSFPQYLVRNVLGSGGLTEDERRNIAIWNDKDHASTRISYKLGLSGPSVTVQTACSSSLVAVHQAVQALLAGDCDLALAGGMAIRLPVVSGYRYREGNVDSRRGHCRAFSADADGIVPGSGGGIVVLRRLEDARTDGDTIRAVIRGSAVNNDGDQKVGYTAPSVVGQARVIRDAYTIAQVSPADVNYIEAHGTGTRLGDPIEVAALSEVFTSDRSSATRCLLGSVKTNIGHLDVAAGIAGLIKTVLALWHREIPPSLNYTEPNPEIDFATAPFAVVEKSTRWDGSTQRFAGVSSFGIGGTNAHVVLQAAPADDETTAEDEGAPEVIPLSARSASALDAMSARLASSIEGSTPALSDVARTCQIGRREFGHRRVVVAGDLREAVDGLRRPDEAVATSKRTVFIFPGQGAQSVGGRDLFATETVFQNAVDECASSLESLLGRDIRDLIFAEPDAAGAANDVMNNTRYAQPALFTIGYALARLWMSWGVVPDAMIGHSVGEYVAACVSGVLTVDDAVRLIAARGRLMQGVPPGIMLAAACGEKDLRDLLAVTGGSLAAVNAPDQCVASGSPGAMDALATRLEERDIDFKRIATSHAFHSAMMDQITPEFRRLLSEVELRGPRLRFQSSLTGTWITDEQATDPGYWVNQLRQPVRFADGLASAAQDGPAVFIEMATRATLTPLVRRAVEGAAAVCSMDGSGTEPRRIRQALGKVWCAGVSVDWAAVRAGRAGRRIPLPTYPFERHRYWIEPQLSVPRTSARSTRPEPSATGSAAQVRGFVPYWRPAPALPIGSGVHGDACLVVGERRSSDAIVKGLRDLGRHVEQVGIGTDYRSALARSAHPAGRVIYVCPERPWAEVSSAGESIFNDLLFLTQELARSDRDVRLSVVTVSAQAVVAGDRLDLRHAPVHGIVSVAPVDCPNVEAHSIDVAGPVAAETAGIIAEILQDGRREPAVALRGGHRWVPDVEAAGEGPDPAGRGLRDGGSYLITGGLGAVGLQLAGYLARTHRARLVLTGRRTLPDQASWTELLTHSATAKPDDNKATIRALQDLIDGGSEILVRKVDVRDVSGMGAVAAEAAERFGPLHGVFHLAYVAGGPMIPRRTPADVAAEFAPKIAGVLALDDVFRDQSLDFFAIFSSLNVLSAGHGAVANVAASTFVDRFSHAVRGQRPYPVVSVNWPMWSGIAPPSVTAFRERMASQGIAESTIPPAEGLAILGKLLADPPGPQVMISGTDLRERIAGARETGPTPTRDEPAPRVVPLPARDAVRRAWQEVLGTSELDDDVEFGSLGGDSLSASQVVARLKDDYGLKLSLEDFFAAPTIRGNADAIMAQDTAPPGHRRDVIGSSREVEQILDDIEQMSIDEVRARLAETSRPEKKDG